jgi:hypothetical protein
VRNKQVNYLSPPKPCWNNDDPPSTVHSNRTIPTPRLTSLNFNSLSNEATTVDGNIRRSNLIACIRALLSTTDIFVGQETHLPLHETNALRHTFPNWEIYYSNAGYDVRANENIDPPSDPCDPRRRLCAGTLTMVSRSFLKNYHVQDLGGIPGHVQALDFHPNDPDSNHGFRVINTYLSNKDSRKEEELQSILGLEVGYRLNYLLGDFNFVEDVEDASGDRSLNAACNTIWGKVKDKFGLREATQPAHTYWRLNDNKDTIRSSRLDRIYHSHREADQTIFRPTAFIPNMPYNTIKKQLHRLEHGNTPTSMNGPDHLPISLRHVPTARKGKRDKNIPEWVFSCPGFKNEFNKNWRSQRRGFGGYNDFVQCLELTSKNIQAFNLENSMPSVAKDLSVAISALRELQKDEGEQDGGKLQRLSSASPCLQACLHHGKLDATLLANAIDDILSKGTCAPEFLPKRTKRTYYQDTVQEAKIHFPSTRRRLTHICKDGVLHTEPKIMAQLIQRQMQPQWDPRKNAPDVSNVIEWLGDYTKRIDSSLLPFPPNRSDDPHRVGSTLS